MFEQVPDILRQGWDILNQRLGILRQGDVFCGVVVGCFEAGLGYSTPGLGYSEAGLV